jgi:hypothetical protein
MKQSDQRNAGEIKKEGAPQQNQTIHMCMATSRRCTSHTACRLSHHAQGMLCVASETECMSPAPGILSLVWTIPIRLAPMEIAEREYFDEGFGRRAVHDVPIIIYFLTVEPDFVHTIGLP